MPVLVPQENTSAVYYNRDETLQASGFIVRVLEIVNRVLPKGSPWDYMRDFNDQRMWVEISCEPQFKDRLVAALNNEYPSSLIEIEKGEADLCTITITRRFY
jgi:hypothetical protein